MAQNIAISDRLKAQNLCIEILQNHTTGDLVQIGDCYAILIQIESDSTKALRLLEEMTDKGLQAIDYIEEEAIQSIHKAAGSKRRSNDASQRNNESEEDNE